MATIQRFKNSVTYAVLLLVIDAGLVTIIEALPIQRGVIVLLDTFLLILIVISFDISLCWLYKTTKVLNLGGKLNFSPALLVILAFLTISVPQFFIIAIVVYTIIWNKAASYQKETP
jgi:membrane glycosyltransferase